MFPELDQVATCNDLVVISDEGQVYLNNSAWIMAIYALEEYRDWAYRLAHPLVLPFVRRLSLQSPGTATLSRGGCALRTRGLAGELRQITLEPCAVPGETVSDYLR